ncbi:Scavenger receptor class B member 1 [Orchesella cincta]|uniref:Scavenger receptor class B member 1 n=1 Tax=Orchesella cincta TaxID=48709 RepID=A0A1D2NCT5_ORCCI|nr:Scavenger receptor class B member 1 [Orchesella cincta]
MTPLIGGGTVLLALTAALGWGGVSMIINGQLRQSARLFNGSDTWRNFKENPNPIYRSFYLFNIENADGIATGEKPKVKERGPYVYLERQWKEDISIDKENDTIGFRQYRSYEFQPEMSTGNTEEDMITMLNMPLLGLAKMIQEVPEANRRLMASFSDKMSGAAEKVTVQHPVRELLFEGFGVRPYQEFAEGKSEILSEVGGDFIFPETFMDGRFGLFEKKNFSDDGIWEITGGRKRNSAYGAMEKINAMDTLPYWKDDTCNALNGTVPTMFQPPLKAGRAMQTFEIEYCRSRTFEYEKEEMLRGVQSFRYLFKKEDMFSPEKNPDNWCFCPYEDASKCNLNGIGHLAPCMEGLPFLISAPHFLDADPSVLETVEGLAPDVEKHGTYMYLSPPAGIILEARKRYQLSMELGPVPGMSVFSSVHKSYVPLMWVEEATDAAKTKFTLFKFLSGLQQIVDMVRWGFLGASIVIIVVGVFAVATRRNSLKSDKITLIQ